MVSDSTQPPGHQQTDSEASDKTMFALRQGENSAKNTISSEMVLNHFYHQILP